MLLLSQFLSNQKGRSLQTCSIDACGGDLLNVAMHIGPLPKWDGRVERWCWVKFKRWGVLLIWILVGQGPTALDID